MNPVPKFSFIFKTDHGNGRISEHVLTETSSRDRAVSLRHKLSSVYGGFTQARLCKKVKVLDVDPERYLVFSAVQPPKKGDIFNSLDALASRMECSVATLRAAFSRAYKTKAKKATVRGITYAYAD